MLSKCLHCLLLWKRFFGKHGILKRLQSFKGWRHAAACSCVIKLDGPAFFTVLMILYALNLVSKRQTLSD